MRTRVISIAGAKGSPGCSFLAAALGLCLGDGGISTLLIGGDAEGGGLASQFATRPASSGPVEVAKHVQLLEIEPGDGDAVERRDLLDASRTSHHAVVIDLGHHVGPLQRRLAAGSDWLLWVVVPDRCGLERADRAIGSGALAATGAGLILNRIRRDALAEAGHAMSSRHGLPLMARIKDSARIADRIAQGRPAFKLREVRQTIAQLARSVHPDAPIVHPAWP